MIRYKKFRYKKPADSCESTGSLNPKKEVNMENFFL